MQIFGSDSKLSHLDQQSEKDWTFRFFKNKYVCLIMTDNDWLEKVTPSLELVRISNHAIKGMIEANSWKNRSKLSQSQEINHVVWWVRTSKTLSIPFQSVTYLSVFCVIILWNILLQKCFTNSMYIVKTFRRQVCLFDLVLSLSNKIKYCILLYRTPSLSFILVCYETMTSKNVDAQRSYLQ